MNNKEKQIFYDNEFLDFKDIDCLNNVNIQQNLRVDFCANCDTDEFLIRDESAGKLVCEQCGSLVCDIFDDGPEWGHDADGNDQIHIQIGINHLLQQSSLGTDFVGYGKIQMIQNWCAMPYRERSLWRVFKYIHEKCDLGNMPKCVEDDAKILFRIFYDSQKISNGKKIKTIVRGKNRIKIIAACIFYSCRRNGVSRRPKEIAKIFQIENSELSKGMKILKKTIDGCNFTQNMGTSEPEHFINRFCKELKMTTEQIEKTSNIAKLLQTKKLDTVHTPLSIAIGSILLVADIYGLKNVDKKILINKFGISDITISKIYKTISQNKNILDVNQNNNINKDLNNRNKNDKISSLSKNNIKKDYCFELDLLKCRLSNLTLKDSSDLIVTLNKIEICIGKMID